jgi:pterin-4a-carbinolamine dehydratase
MTALTHDETSEEMKDVPDWTHQAKTIVRTYKFDGFPKSIAFVDQIAKCAQKLDHQATDNILSETAVAFPFQWIFT